MKKADNSIGVISEAVGTPTKKSLKDVDNMTSTEELLNGDESEDQVLLMKCIKDEELINPINRDSLEYIDNSEADDATFVIRALTERPVEGGPMFASVEDLKDFDPDIDVEEMKVIRRIKKRLYVSDLSKKLKDPMKTKSVYQKSQLYLGVLLLVSIYYSLPVLQMVFR